MNNVTLGMVLAWGVLLHCVNYAGHGGYYCIHRLPAVENKPAAISNKPAAIIDEPPAVDAQSV
jgi:hypothetical protein